MAVLVVIIIRCFVASFILTTGVRARLEELGGVANPHIGLRILERSVGHSWKVLFAHVDADFVELEHVRLFDAATRSGERSEPRSVATS